MNHKLNAALAYCRAGLAVVPWAYTDDANGKTPTRKWAVGEVPVMTEQEVVDWWNYRQNDNVGIITGESSGVVTVDLDNDTAILWAQQYLPPTPWRVQTGRGQQWGYRSAGPQTKWIDVFNNEHSPGQPKLDIIADRIYSAMPPSIHKNGKTYQWMGEVLPQVSSLPAFDIRWFPDRPAAGDVDGVDLDDGLAGDPLMARMWLRDQEPCISGKGGQTRVFFVCCALLRDFYLTWEDAWAELWTYNQRCDPPWSPDELQHHLEGAIERGTTPRGQRRTPFSPSEVEYLRTGPLAWIGKRAEVIVNEPTPPPPMPMASVTPTSRPTDANMVKVANPSGEVSAKDFLEHLASEGAQRPGVFFKPETAQRLAAISITAPDLFHNFLHDVKKLVSLVDLRKAVVTAQKEMRRSIMKAAGDDAPEDHRERVTLSGDEMVDRNSILTILRKTSDIYVAASQLAYVTSEGYMERLNRGALRNAVANNCYLSFAAPKDDGTVAYRSAALPTTLLSMLEALLPHEIDAMRRVDQITRSPVFTPSGAFIKDVGYVDEVHTLIHDCPTIDMDAFPTQAQALAYLEDIFKDFPFASRSEWANYLGALLTPMMRHMYTGPTPWLLIEANVPGAGKSLLAKCIQLIYGYSANMDNLPVEEKEIAKTVATSLRTARPVVTYDNVKVVIDSATIEAVATASDEFTMRLLGTQEALTSRVRTLFVITSNNARMGLDAARRFIRVRLQKDHHTVAGTDLPDHTIRDLETYVTSSRAAILSALARIILDWVADGQVVSPSVMIVPTYEAFSRHIGGCLHHAGMTEWGDNAQDLHQNMQSLDEWVPFTHEWYKQYIAPEGGRTKALFAADIYDFTMRKGLMGYIMSFARDENARKSFLGTKLNEKRDVPVGDFIIRKMWDEGKKMNKYYLERVRGTDAVQEPKEKVVH